MANEYRGLGLNGGQYGAQRLLCFGLGCVTQIALNLCDKFRLGHIVRSVLFVMIKVKARPLERTGRIETSYTRASNEMFASIQISFRDGSSIEDGPSKSLGTTPSRPAMTISKRRFKASSLLMPRSATHWSARLEIWLAITFA